MTRALNPNDPNVVMVERVARRLGVDLCDRFAFVGGAVARLICIQQMPAACHGAGQNIA